jgi:M6 family metalloprotease-like protein
MTRAKEWAAVRQTPVRNNHDDCYFSDPYQALPTKGYTAIFERLLDSRHIRVRTKTDYFKVKDCLKCGRLYYTGPIEDWFVASETEEYYSYGIFGITNYFAKCAYEALDRVDEQGFNFTEYDQDGDGVIDRVVILHSGYVAEGDGTDCINGKPHGSHRIWSHTTTAPDTPEDGWYSKDGSIRLGTYSATSAVEGVCSSHICRIGLIGHEYMHTLGLQFYKCVLRGVSSLCVHSINIHFRLI